jgi:hypothetical protein
MTRGFARSLRETFRRSAFAVKPLRLMLSPIDNYFLRLDEPTRSCLQFLREHILKKDQNISEAWKYGMPFFCYQRRMFCYFWTHKKYLRPYIGIVEGKRIDHPDLIVEKRARMKIFLLSPEEDLPIEKIDEILDELIVIYKETI